MKKIIPAFDFTKSLTGSIGFSITKLEESYTGYNAMNPHRHKYYEVLYFKGAGGIHEIDFNMYPIKANSIHFVSPDQVHLLRRDKDVAGFVLSFNDDFFLESETGKHFIDQIPYFNNPYIIPELHLKDEADKSECDSLVLKIQNEFNTDRPDKRIALQSWMKLFLIMCKRLHSLDMVDNETRIKRSEITINFKKLIDKNFMLNKSVSDYAQILNITPGHLSETIQKDTGKTAGEIIHDRVILEAKRLLYHSHKSIKEIAAELHFEDPSYFTKFFKNQTESTPEQFRQAIREKYH